MDKVAVVAGENMIVHCPVAGYPIDSIVWEKSKYYMHKFLYLHQVILYGIVLNFLDQEMHIILCLLEIQRKM